VVRGEEQGSKETKEKREKITQEHVFEARKEVSAIHLSESMEKYIVNLIDCTRFPSKYSKELTNGLIMAPVQGNNCTRQGFKGPCLAE
jgi:MoxR-like ATPase